MADNPIPELDEHGLQAFLAEFPTPLPDNSGTAPVTEETIPAEPYRVSAGHAFPQADNAPPITNPFTAFESEDEFDLPEFDDWSEEVPDQVVINHVIQMSRALSHAGQSRAARELLADLVSLRDSPAAAWYELALLSENRREKRHLLQKALNRQPDLLPAAQLLHRLERHPGKLAELFHFDPKQLIDVDCLPTEDDRLPLLPTVDPSQRNLLELAIHAIREDNNEAGALLLGQVLALDPDNPVAWAWLIAVAPNETACRHAIEQACELNGEQPYLTTLRRQFARRAQYRLLLTNPVLYLGKFLTKHTWEMVRNLVQRREELRARHILETRLNTLLLEEVQSVTSRLDMRSNVIPSTLLEEMEKLFQKASPSIRVTFQRSLNGLVTAEPGSDQERQSLEMLFELVLSEDELGIPFNQRQQLIQRLRSEVFGYGPLEPLLNDESLTAIFINGTWGVFVERKGALSRLNRLFDNEEHLLRILERILRPFGLVLDEQHLFVSTRLPDGSRLNAIGRPISLGGPSITIRKFPRRPLMISDLIRFGSLTPEIANFLRACVVSRLNILISGGAGECVFGFHAQR